jgi:hypothetical protein
LQGVHEKIALSDSTSYWYHPNFPLVKIVNMCTWEHKTWIYIIVLYVLWHEGSKSEFWSQIKRPLLGYGTVNTRWRY